MRFTHLTLRSLVVPAVFAVLLAGCSDDAGETDPGPLDTQEQAPTTVPSTVQGATGSDGGGGGGPAEQDQPSNQTPQDPSGGTGDQGAGSNSGGTGAGSNDEWNSETDGRDAG